MVDEKPVPPLNAARLSLTEHRRRGFSIDVDIGIEPEALTNPAYWAHVAREFRMGDHIEAWAEDGSWYAELLVLDVGANWAKVHLRQNSIEKLQAVSPEARPTILAGHSVAWAGRHALWRVVRDGDQKVLKDRLASKDEAFTWLANYSRSIAA